MTANQINGQSFTVLLVEDNPAHAELILRSFEAYQTITTIYHVSDGEAALDYLFRRGAYADPTKSPRPHVVLLDLRLPKIDGLEVLQEIKNSNDLKKTPVIILTTSNAEQDKNRAYEQYVNSYLVKPVDFEQFMKLMNEFGCYWLDWNQSPHLWDVI